MPIVPAVEIFGDPNTDLSVDFVHIEEIRTTSCRYDWEISPHFHARLFQLVAIEKGGGALTADGIEHRLAGPVVVVLPSGTIHSFQFVPQTEGWVLTIPESLLFDPALSAPSDLFAGMGERSRIIGLERDLMLAARLFPLLSRLLEEFVEERPERMRMLDYLIRPLLLEVQRAATAAEEPASPQAPEALILARFRGLTDRHYKDHWSVRQYSRALNMTESKLNRLCLNLRGKSAFALIRDRLLLEAKRKLVYAAIPVNVLAAELGFDDPSYFSRFFRKQVGVSPANFRAAREVTSARPSRR